MIHRLLMKICLYRWWVALRLIAEWEIPPADHSESYRMQGELYNVRNVARGALWFKERRVTSHNKCKPPFLRILWRWIIGKNNGCA